MESMRHANDLSDNFRFVALIHKNGPDYSGPFFRWHVEPYFRSESAGINI